MRAFDFFRAETLPAALGATAAGARAIAGGTNLLDLMKLDIERPDTLIDIGRLPMRGVERTADGGLRIGALLSNAELAAEATVRKDYPVLARALLAGASAQIRNKATTAGNLLQRTRCAYFYAPGEACNKREPGAGCAAIGGVTRMHAVLGVSEACIAAHPSDMAVAMLLLDAVVEIEAADGRTRTVPLADFYRLPGDTPHIENALSPAELIVAVTLPPPIAGRQAYRKVRDRASYAFALVSLASVIDVAGGRIGSARLALGGLGARPWRVMEAEAVLAGRTPDSEAAEAAADVLLAGARTEAENAFKLPLARRLIAAAVLEAGKDA